MLKSKIQIEPNWLKISFELSGDQSGPAAPAKLTNEKRPPPSAFMMEMKGWKLGTALTKAICLPSRDHAGVKSAANVFDNTANPVPSALRTQMRSGDAMLPSGWRRHVYASRVPSGDHEGAVSGPAASVIFTMFVPSGFIR